MQLEAVWPTQIVCSNHLSMVVAVPVGLMQQGVLGSSTVQCIKGASLKADTARLSAKPAWEA
jgi:hypothetical protein